MVRRQITLRFMKLSMRQATANHTTLHEDVHETERDADDGLSLSGVLIASKKQRAPSGRRKHGSSSSDGVVLMGPVPQSCATTVNNTLHWKQRAF
mmetsp:Transcript_15767/g.23222  ORF Transcript_15767/g.23222 Transcript_15767/m.23222 type:complete len:95 (+) Transcript_15767:183-467(+)